MKRFLIKISLFSTIVFLLFLGLEFLISEGLKKSKKHHFADWNALFKGEINADVIINGSSKALVQVSTIVIDSTLKVNSYNLGINGHDFYMQNSKYFAYTKYNTTPKLVVQIIGNGSLKKRTDLYAFDQFLPYIDDPIIKEVTQDYIGLTSFDYYLPFVRYFGSKTSINEGLISFFECLKKKSDPHRYKGYRPNSAEWDGSFERFVRYCPNGKTIHLTDTSIQLFKKFLSYHKKEDIPLVLVYPPTYDKSQKYINNRAEIMALYDSMAQEYNIPLLDYSKLSMAKDKTYFYNSQHLNRKGAELFSKKLAQDLQKYIQPK